METKAIQPTIWYFMTPSAFIAFRPNWRPSLPGDALAIV
jgi:hypothetical protein